ncbi:MAG: phenylalanine--tRNA ligase subunit beta [Pseudomonadota bacterium]
MKFSESWLREWINPKLSRPELAECLTMAGLEIDELAPVASEFSKVVVAEILAVKKHPDADNLTICEVAAGGKPLTIVCGAGNVKPHLKVPAALIGAVLPNNVTIKATNIRGIPSAGMLCSASDLGLSDDNEGLFELPADAPVGVALWDYLKLSDYVIDVAITPNRGDCLSLLGMATEISALTAAKITPPKFTTIKPAHKDVLPVTIHKNAQQACPCYVGRVIRGVQADAPTPIWLRERLRRSGIRSISPVVDVTNYVMLELGQPMHAFTLETLSGGIEVRMAKTGEELALLDGSEVKLDTETLVIADKQKALAVAGVMGGMDSRVTLLTQNIFLESAYFQPQATARAARRYHINSDSSYRFERGIDPLLQRKAMERATQLLLEITGGSAGPIIDVSNKNLPQPVKINLRPERIKKILGCDVPAKQVEKILQSLQFDVKTKAKTASKKTPPAWQVTVPPRRSDVTTEIDLIEEIARLYGYDKIPCHDIVAALQINPGREEQLALSTLRRAFYDLGYQEVVTYSFIDPKLQAIFHPGEPVKELLNPMTADMAVMRGGLWPGLVNTLLYNQNRQQERVRIFESGRQFVFENNQLQQQMMLSGLICGTAFPKQWGNSNRLADFFDLKGDLENIFKLTFDQDEFIFKTGTHAALHPGQTAEIIRDGQKIGILGMLHPSISQALKVEGSVFLFSLMLDSVVNARIPNYQSLSKFPEIHRDIAILLDQSVPALEIQDTIREQSGELLKNIDIFDVYQGKGIPAGQKSIALSLTLQHSSRTLIDEEVAKLMERIIVALKERFNAELRG